MKEQKDSILHVQMFGSFSMIWNGKHITGGSRSSETQFAYLMQILLHNRKRGVSREQLERNLFEDRDIKDYRHAVRTVIYNTKKRLKAAGLPDVNYIRQQDGVYYWTEDIAVEEDAEKLDLLYRKAQEEIDSDRKLRLYLEACHCYTGEFLKNQTAVVWVAQEARRYREIFCSCTEKAAALLRECRDYQQMETLGRYAAKVNPLADWETVTMEALAETGRIEDALRLYDDTVEFYMQEGGLRPSERLMEMLNRLGTLLDHQYALLDVIQDNLAGNEEDKSGYFCSYPVFQGIYRMVRRTMERSGQSVHLMLCTIVDSKGNPMKDGPMLSELSGRLKESIVRSVRRSDAISRYGKGQWLILLMNTTVENCRILQKRINYHFVVGRQRTAIQYHVSSVICTSDGRRIT